MVNRESKIEKKTAAGLSYVDTNTHAPEFTSIYDSRIDDLLNAVSFALPDDDHFAA